MRRKQCPECDSFSTDRVHTEWLNDGVEEVRICDNCDVQFTNGLWLHEQESFRYGDNE